jgi:uncharacterized protein YndB with AHSA1/START domain
MDIFWEVVYWVAVGVACVAGILAGIALLGCFLPRGHVASRSLRTRKPPEAVWEVVRDFAATPTWHPEVQRVERLPDHDGREVWRETDRRGYPLQLETVEAAAPHRLVRAIADEKGPFSGQWEFDIQPADDGGSRVTLTEQGQIPNPFFRFMFRMFMTPTWYLELYLKALAVKLGDEPVLEPRS